VLLLVGSINCTAECILYWVWHYHSFDDSVRPQHLHWCWPQYICGHTYSGLLLAASRPYVSYVASGDLFHHLSLQTLVIALVLARLDYGNATLWGLPSYLISSLQPVINAAARSIAGIRRSDHIRNTLASFHWLHEPERIKFKLHGGRRLPSSPRHSTSLSFWTTLPCCWYAGDRSSPVVDGPPVFLTSDHHAVPLLVTAYLSRPVQGSWTVFVMMSHLPHLY